MRKNKNIF